MASNHKPVFAVSALLFAASLWGVTWYPLRFLQGLGMNGLWTSLVVYGSAALASSFLLPRCFQEFRQAPFWFGMIALGSAWCNVAFILAVLEGNVVRVLLMFYLSPVWATLMGWLWLKERLSPQAWITFVIAMLGAVIMLWNPDMGRPFDFAPADLLALSSGFAFAFANIGIRRLESFSIHAKLLANWWGGMLLALCMIVLLRMPAPDLELDIYVITASFGVILVVAMSYSVAYGVSHLPVHQSAVILLFELVVGTLSSLWLTEEIIQMREWVGGALIISAAYITGKSVKG